MSEEYIEVSAKTIEEAITQASQKLSVPSDMLEVEVVDQGSSGFLGFNAKPAVIRAKAKKEATKADHVQGDVLSEVHKNSVDQETGEVQNAGKAPAAEDTDWAEGEAEEQEDADSLSFSDHHYVDNEPGASRSRKNYRRSSRSSYDDYGASRAAGKNYVAHSRSTDDFLSTTSDSSRSASRNRRRSRYDRQGRSDRDARYDRQDRREGEAYSNHGDRYRGRGYTKGYGKDRYPDYANSSSYDETSTIDTQEAAEAAAKAQAAYEHRHDEPKVVYTQEQIDMFQERAETFLRNMFQAMNMEVTISSNFDKEENILTVDFEGEDMGVLIGKRGQTLDSIQYLVSLIVNKDVPGYVHVKADTENYRERRKKTLENLAKNMAVKVKKTRRAQALEPMNPYERRIIHSALQGDKYVTTYSEGEDPYRRVVITLKK